MHVSCALLGSISTVRYTSPANWVKGDVQSMLNAKETVFVAHPSAVDTEKGNAVLQVSVGLIYRFNNAHR